LVRSYSERVKIKGVSEQIAENNFFVIYITTLSMNMECWWWDLRWTISFGKNCILYS